MGFGRPARSPGFSKLREPAACFHRVGSFGPRGSLELRGVRAKSCMPIDLTSWYCAEPQVSGQPFFTILKCARVVDLMVRVIELTSRA